MRPAASLLTIKPSPVMYTSKARLVVAAPVVKFVKSLYIAFEGVRRHTEFFCKRDDFFFGLR